MPAVNCFIVEVGGVVAFEAAENIESVAVLQAKLADALKYPGRVFDLQLFLARKDKEWLNEEQAAAMTVNAIGTEFAQLRPLKSLQTYLEEQAKKEEGEVTLEAGKIHVLVNAPSTVPQIRPREEANIGEEPGLKLTTFDMTLKSLSATCRKRDKLPKEGVFLNLFEWTDDNYKTTVDIRAINDIMEFTGPTFYVRKEILRVLKNFDATYPGFREDTSTLDDSVRGMQFVLFGSPGTGKSCILALLCFYIAIKKQLPVVWHRHVAAGAGSPPITRVFYKGLYYEWDDDELTTYKSLYYSTRKVWMLPVSDCWFCLDGLCQRDIQQKGLSNMFQLLATSGQYDVKDEAYHLVTRCMVPYWKEDDLVRLGNEFLLDNSESSIADRYFFSGGNLRQFLAGAQTTKDQVDASLQTVANSKHAENLLTADGSMSEKKIDRIRTRGVDGITEARDYVTPGKWRVCITSQYVLRRLARVMSPEYFEQLIKIAQGMNDRRLEGVAYEGRFHSQVRQQREFEVDYWQYDNASRTKNTDWMNIMAASKASMKWGPFEKVEYSCNSQDQAIRLMEKWAADPAQMDYWIPTTSLFETIDAVLRCTKPDGSLCFTFLKLTMADKHKCNAEILSQLMAPFVAKTIAVDYMALVPALDKPGDEAYQKAFEFRLDPVEIEIKIGEDDVVKSGVVKLHVGCYRLGDHDGLPHASGA